MYRLESDFKYTVTDTGDPTMNEALDEVYDHLVKQLGAPGVVIAADRETSTFALSVVLDEAGDESVSEAFGRGMSMIRTAFHATGGGTPRWREDHVTHVETKIKDMRPALA